MVCGGKRPDLWGERTLIDTIGRRIVAHTAYATDEVLFVYYQA